MKRPLGLGEGMRDEQGWHATDCQPIVSRRSIRVRQFHRRVKTLRILVGATGFEPATPCAQGRCATRLRYAPTLRIRNCTADSQNLRTVNSSRRMQVTEALGWLDKVLGSVQGERRARHRAVYVLANPLRLFVIVNVPSCATEALIQ